MAIRPAELGAPSDDKRWRIVETRMRRTGQRPDALIEVLHAAQEAFGYLDPDALEFIGGALGVPLSKVYGAARILAEIRGRLGVGPRETTEDDKLSVLTARCLGACSLAPAMILDGEVHGKLTPGGVAARLEAL